MAVKKKKIRKRAYADVGSHGGIFMFEIGPVADRYPTLLQIYHKKVTEDLVPVIIEYYIPTKSTQ